MVIGGKPFPINKKTYLLGILNITPDSFYNGNRYMVSEKAIDRARQLEKEGADIIDVGGESTRPGSNPVSLEEELQRVIPVIRAIIQSCRIPVSIDTNKSAVAAQALDAGAALINDISALTFDDKMAELAAGSHVPVILMHMQETPKTMQKNPYYHDVVQEIGDYLLNRAAFAEKKGIRPENIILDPGIGFGKRLEDNIRLVRDFPKYINHRYPVLIGHSRKRFIGSLLDRENTRDRLFGSLGAAAAAVHSGADFLRVHDVLETRELLEVIFKITRG
jgi:dihydropteroate synthase